MDIFRYKQAELDYLRKKDKKLAAAIDRIGIIERGVNKDLFSALIGSIVSQQISNKAAETVGNKLIMLCGGITPESIHNTDIADVQKCGMSMRKARKTVYAPKVIQQPLLTDGRGGRRASAPCFLWNGAQGLLDKLSRSGGILVSIHHRSYSIYAGPGKGSKCPVKTRIGAIAK